MAEKKPIYKIEPWNITEDKFEPENIYRNETTFALSNGYIGTRGTFEQGYEFSVDEGLEGNYINGFYESEQIHYGEWNFGFPTTSQSLLNLPNLKIIKLEIEGEMLDIRTGTFDSYNRVLHMKEGIVTNEFIWTSASNKKVQIGSRRFVSLTHKNCMCMSYSVIPLNFSGKVSLSFELAGEVENHTRKTNPLVDYGPFGRHLLPDKAEAEKGSFYYEGTTINSKLTMACGSRHILYTIDRETKEAQILEEIKQVETRIQKDEEKGNAWISYSFHAIEGEKILAENYIIYTSMLDMPTRELENFVKNELTQKRNLGYRKLEKEQLQYMQEFWETADIKIGGDDALQQGIRFNLFHIMQAAGRDGKTGMGAKGLSGEGYEGHYFWDTEMYVMPVFAYTHAKTARALLDYRYKTLNEARDRARILGHEKGALYPWRTINGKEASTYFPLGTAQYHINADIAYAFKLYVDVTGDYEYLEKKAAEVLIETARVWADVGCFAESKGNKYCICAVTGPDEYNAIVDNNFYTNLMARENIKDAIFALETIQRKNPEAYTELTKRLELTAGEVDYWKQIAENMYFPYDDKRKIYPLDDGFMQRKPWDDSKIPPEKRHLLYENYHPLFIFRQRMSKQADAILGMLLHSNLFTEEELKRNYDFYQEVTLHHSSLSTCIFGILASQIGYYEEAYRYFSESARMDLDDYHNNFYAGIHAANMAGTWQGIVFGFAGVRTNKGILECKPTIPEKWNEYSFKLQYRGSSIAITITKQNAIFTLENDIPITFEVAGKQMKLEKKGESYLETI